MLVKECNTTCTSEAIEDVNTLVNNCNGVIDVSPLHLFSVNTNIEEVDEILRAVDEILNED